MEWFLCQLDLLGVCYDLILSFGSCRNLYDNQLTELPEDLFAATTQLQVL